MYNHMLNVLTRALLLRVLDVVDKLNSCIEGKLVYRRVSGGKPVLQRRSCCEDLLVRRCHESISPQRRLDILHPNSVNVVSCCEVSTWKLLG